MAKFRFENLNIWKSAIDIADKLFDVADGLEEKKFFDLQNSSELQLCRCLIISQKAQVLIQVKTLRIS